MSVFEDKFGPAIISNDSEVTADSFVTFTEHPILITFCAFLFVIGVLGNTLVLVLFYLDRKRIDIGHYYILSMAVSDLFEVSIGTPLTAFFRIFLTIDDPLCPIVHGTKVTIYVWCLFSVVLTAFDRYWAIVHMVHHRNNSSKKIALGI